MPDGLSADRARGFTCGEPLVYALFVEAVSAVAARHENLLAVSLPEADVAAEVGGGRGHHGRGGEPQVREEGGDFMRYLETQVLAAEHWCYQGAG